MRSHARHRRAVIASAVAAAALLLASWPAQGWLTAREFETSLYGAVIDGTAEVAGDRPLVAFVGTSQTQSGIDALAIERSLAGVGAPVVADVAVAGTHASAYPAIVRALLARWKPRLVVLEFGHIVHDQYGGAWATRNYVTDDPVIDSLRGTARGQSLTALIDGERRFPWTAIPRTARVVIDARGRAPERNEAVERMRSARGFQPYRAVKDSDEVVRVLEEEFRDTGRDMADASPQACFVATAALCARLCRERGVPLVVLMQPVNRAIAPRVPVLRHFEETARAATIPALRAAGIEVLVPPEELFDGVNFYDHVHLHAEGATKFSAWVGGEMARLLAPR